MDNKSRIKIYEVDTEVISNNYINNDYKHLILRAPSRALDIVPGQFFHLQCPTFEGSISFLRRPMSVYQFSKKEKQIEFLYKLHGKGTRAISNLKKNNIFNIVGPLGKGFLLEENYKNIVLIARGVGLATLAPLGNLAFEKGINLTVICSARSKEHLMSIDLFNSLSNKVITVTDNDGSSSMVNLELLINNLMLSQSVDAFFTCGSNRILKLLKKLCGLNNIPGQIALEQQMACGIGMCFCCVRPFEIGNKIIQKRVCNEGPVFRISEALPW
ncbi:MAG: dihydroorotate dehydrogenase electron transfer subunit [Proteobacteria bacterium]|nr:dihydroorotate dehydrogenase electron transfer subunit [Pseudomonadota bacterium]MDA1136577.1 dihydroorotate dehydrogenase electron transfer subunit [Pseudomonadota bacterium]